MTKKIWLNSELLHFACYIIFDILIYTCIYPYRVPFFINDIYYLIEYIEDIHFCVVFLCCVPIQISHGPVMYPSILESSKICKMVTWGVYPLISFSGTLTSAPVSTTDSMAMPFTSTLTANTVTAVCFGLNY